MNIAEVKRQIISQVEHIEDASFLEAIMQLINTRVASGTYRLSDEQKNRVAEARAEFEGGDTVSGEQLMNNVEKWLDEKQVKRSF